MQDSVFNNSNVDDCSVVVLPQLQTEKGAITALNNSVEIPFETRRVHYLYDVPGGAERGGHAHRELHQLIVAVSGSFDVIINDGFYQRTISLNRPYHGLLVAPSFWERLKTAVSFLNRPSLRKRLYRHDPVFCFSNE